MVTQAEERADPTEMDLASESAWGEGGGWGPELRQGGRGLLRSDWPLTEPAAPRDLDPWVTLL